MKGRFMLQLDSNVTDSLILSSAIKPFRVNTAAATAMVHAKTSTNVEDLRPATLVKLF